MDEGGEGEVAFMIFIEGFGGSEGETFCTVGAADMGVVDCEAGVEDSPAS